MKMAPVNSRQKLIWMMKNYITIVNLLLLLQMQLYGFILLYKIFEIRRNNMILQYLSSKTQNASKKRKYNLNKTLSRKKRSTWDRFVERSDDWWKKMLSEEVSDQCWKKNFRMGKDAFYELCIL